jgi:DNA-binding CsgD family transcriptional regulator
MPLAAGLHLAGKARWSRCPAASSSGWRRSPLARSRRGRPRSWCSPRGLANDWIACELVLAPSTVKRHLANIYQKIGVRSRSEAVRRALQEQWIGLGEITEAADTDGSEGG